MNKQAFKAHMHSVRTNGNAYTLRHIANVFDRQVMRDYLESVNCLDWLAYRAHWMAHAFGDSNKTIIRCTTGETKMMAVGVDASRALGIAV